MSESVSKVLKIAAIIVISAVVGIFFGTLASNYELRFVFSREYLGEVNGVEVYAVGDIDRENFVKHVEMLAGAPPELTAACERLYFTGSDVALPAGDSALGLTQGRTVYVSTVGFSSYVVFHELFHAYDNANGELSSNDPKFLLAYRDNKDVIPVFAHDPSLYPSEFFAQAGALCLLMPRELSIAAPETYHYFNDTLGFKG